MGKRKGKKQEPVPLFPADLKTHPLLCLDTHHTQRPLFPQAISGWTFFILVESHILQHSFVWITYFNQLYYKCISISYMTRHLSSNINTPVTLSSFKPHNNLTKQSLFLFFPALPKEETESQRFFRNFPKITQLRTDKVDI